MITIEFNVDGADEEIVVTGATLRAALNAAKSRCGPGKLPDYDNMLVDGEMVRGLCDDCGLPIADESFEMDDNESLHHHRCSDYDPPADAGAMTVDDILRAFHGAKIAATNETDLQDGIASSLAATGITFTREHQLSKADRVDFMVGSIAVEVKVDHSVSALTRQLQRYAQSDEVSEILVVTNRLRLANLPPTLNGKPVRCHVFMVAFS